MAIDNKLILENSQTLNVLYVEDDEQIRNSTGSLFSNFFKSVDHAVDGEDGYQKYMSFLDKNKGAYDLIISDINMPKMNGVEMVKKIKGITPEQSVVFITAFNEPEYLGEAIELGVESYLSKPLDVKSLKETLYKVAQKIVDKKLVSLHYQQIEEENIGHIAAMDVRKFTAAKNIVTELEADKEKISIAWCEVEVVRERLQLHEIDVEYFRTHFGLKVIDYFLSVVNGTSEIGNCPVVFVMLDFFKNKDLPLEDVFMICVHFKNSLTSYIFNKYSFNQELYEDVSLIVDRNFEGVVINYIKMKYHENEPSVVEVKKQKRVPLTEERKSLSVKVVAEAISYVEYFLESDIYELQDLEESIDNLAIAITNDVDIRVDDIVVLGSTIKRYGAILSNYPLFTELGGSIVKLGDAFQVSAQLLYDDKAKMSNITALLEGFVNDLIVWRKEIFVNNIQNPNFLNDSFFSNVDTIIMFIEYDESQETVADDGDMDFFDF